MTKVLITGAKVLSVHISPDNWSKKNATKRNNSNLIRSSDYAESNQWINSDQKDWTDQVTQIKPQILIHTAWGGVSAKDRNNRKFQ